MPTYFATPEFWASYDELTPEQKRLFKKALGRFVDDLRSRRGFRKGLRVKGIRGAEGLFEMTWAPDGRAVFSYGESVKGGEAHIVWHAVGTHEVL